MAMTKKEREAFDHLQRQLEEARAFRFTDDVEPDVMPPTDSGYRAGYLIRPWANYTPVSMAWTASHRHGTGRELGADSRQGGVRLYSTELLAYRAVRRAMEQDFSAKLANIDRKIAELSVAGPETC